MASILKINNPTGQRPKILVAPLDWGLGHATRCIPVIKELLIRKCEVYIAAKGDQKALLIAEFPYLSFVELPGYGIKYDKNRAFTLIRLICSIPKILIRVKEENRWLRQFNDSEGLDAVISDNRYGLWHPGLYCVLITHQLGIKSLLGSWVDSRVRALHYRLIDRFSACWVPDVPEGSGLAGELSHPGKMPHVPTRYIGLLSRMERGAAVEEGSIDLLILLSGPEPQRSILEKKLWEQSKSFTGKVVFVRGLPAGGPPLEGENVYDHLPAGELNKVLSRAEIVVARAGYSTVMDLVRLRKRAILIPTPGQTEQEYLGEYLTNKRIALCVKQAGFSLMDMLERARRFDFVFPEEEGDLLGEVIDQSLSPIDFG